MVQNTIKSERKSQKEGEKNLYFLKTKHQDNFRDFVAVIALHIYLVTIWPLAITHSSFSPRLTMSVCSTRMYSNIYMRACGL